MAPGYPELAQTKAKPTLSGTGPVRSGCLSSPGFGCFGQMHFRLARALGLGRLFSRGSTRVGLRVWETGAIGNWADTEVAAY